MITIEQIKEVFKQFIYLLDDRVIDTMLAVIVANRMPGDSVNLYIIGPSSSAKTEIIRSLIKYPHSYHITKISPRTLVSGYKEPGKKGENYSLLLELKKDGKNILVFKDFTTVMSMRHEDRLELTSQLRELADGYITAVWGNKQRVQFDWVMGIIAGCTNAIDEYSQLTESLGERFLKYRMYAEMDQAIVEKASSAVFIKDDLRIKTADMVQEFLMRFDVVFEYPPWEPKYQAKMESACRWGVRVRSAVIEDSKTHVMITPPVYEGPGRLVSTISKLGSALAIVQGKKTVDKEIYVIIKKIIRDTLSQYRFLIVKLLYENGVMNTSDLAQKLRVTTQTVRKYCEELFALRIIEKMQDVNSKGKGYFWWIASEHKVLIEECEIFLLDQF